jgi:hypothetical protein
MTLRVHVHLKYDVGHPASLALIEKLSCPEKLAELLKNPGL